MRKTSQMVYQTPIQPTSVVLITYVTDRLALLPIGTKDLDTVAYTNSETRTNKSLSRVCMLLYNPRSVVLIRGYL